MGKSIVITVLVPEGCEETTQRVVEGALEILEHFGVVYRQKNCDSAPSPEMEQRKREARKEAQTQIWRALSDLFPGANPSQIAYKRLSNDALDIHVQGGDIRALKKGMPLLSKKRLARIISGLRRYARASGIIQQLERLNGDL